MENEKFESARVAAEWWANALKGRAKQDAGLDDAGGGMGSLLLLFVSRLNQPEDDKIPQFQTKLEEELNKRLAANKDAEICLSVDYGAEGLLAAVARELEINYGTGSAFPVKTVMWISRDRVSVSNGYRAENKTLYPAETKTTPAEKSTTEVATDSPAPTNSNSSTDCTEL